MEDDFQVQLSEDITIDGDHPIVILGPNGSGKSRFGAERLANQNNAEFIPALRGIVLNHNLPKQSFLQADQELKSAITKAPLNYWRLTNDIDQLFAKLLAEDNESAVSFRDQYLSGESTEPEKTNLMLLRDVWKEIFPGRQIDFSTYRPTVRSELGQKSAEYQASKMSDGEKVALYLGARVLNTESRIELFLFKKTDKFQPIKLEKRNEPTNS